jgi:uncharacterized protein YecT (DUF1311 family)
MKHALGLIALGSLMFALCTFSGFPAMAQTIQVPATDMTVFRACLTRAQTETLAKTCDQPVFDACNQRSSMPDTTVTISECLMVQHQAWDRVLNEVWPISLAGLEPKAKTKLRNAQRLWINLRKADCEAVYEANIGGTIRGPAYGACMVEATRTRYFFLKGFPGY